MSKIKKCYNWDIMEYIDAECPYCGYYTEFDGFHGIGELVKCRKCRKSFNLGDPEDYDETKIRRDKK